MQKQIVPKELLQNSKKILFLTHLALGDFTYLKAFLEGLSSKYPNLKIDLLVDEGRGKNFIRRWQQQPSYILYDWLKSCKFIGKIYKTTSPWWKFKETTKKIKKENYQIVVPLCVVNPDFFISYAKKISKNKSIFPLINSPKKHQFIKKIKLKQLGGYLPIKAENKNKHITKTISHWFEDFFDLKLLEKDSHPRIEIPREWICFAKLKFLKWGIDKKSHRNGKVIFINSFAKNRKRCWTINKVFELISKIRRNDKYYNTKFIINFTPSEYKKMEKSINNFASQNIFLFSASVNFFQLPSIISLCDLVISVETSIIHFAAALTVPVIALMRQKNPSWTPYGNKSQIIYTKKRHHWIEDISSNDVFNTFYKLDQTN